METVVKEDGFSTSHNYNLIRCTKVNKFSYFARVHGTRILNPLFEEFKWLPFYTGLVFFGGAALKWALSTSFEWLPNRSGPKQVEIASPVPLVPDKAE